MMLCGPAYDICYQGDAVSNNQPPVRALALQHYTCVCFRGACRLKGPTLGRWAVLFLNSFGVRTLSFIEGGLRYCLYVGDKEPLKLLDSLDVGDIEPLVRVCFYLGERILLMRVALSLACDEAEPLICVLECLGVSEGPFGFLLPSARVKALDVNCLIIRWQ